MMNSVMADVRDKSVFIMFSIVICVWKHCQVENVFVCYSVIRKKCITRNDDRKCIIKRKKKHGKTICKFNKNERFAYILFSFPIVNTTADQLFNLCHVYNLYQSAVCF